MFSFTTPKEASGRLPLDDPSPQPCLPVRSYPFLCSVRSHSPTSHVVLTNYSFLSPLKRQRGQRNRSNINPMTPSKRAIRLPVLAEFLWEEQEEEESSPSSTASTSSTPPPSTASTASTPPHSTSPKAKRISRYGRDEFGAFGLTDDFLSAPPRAAPQPPSSPRPSSSSPSTKSKSKRQSVCLSAFDIIIDIAASEPASPVTETPAAPPSTPPRSRDLGRRSPPRSRSPTPSLTSMSACSSTEMPTTPATSDDEWPGLRSPSNKVARPRISKHPLMVIKSTPSLLASDENSEDTFEFTLVPISPLPGQEAEGKVDQEDVEEEEEEDEALWYSRELSQIVSLSSPRAPSNTPTRPDSLLIPHGAISGTDRPSPRSQISKPLPSVPHKTVPSPQLESQYLTIPPRLTLRPSANPTTPPSPLTLPPPAALSTSRKPESQGHSIPTTSITSSSSARKSLTITVPRAHPSTTLKKEVTVSDILDDINAWSLGTPSASTSSSTCTNALALSPPRVPHSPAVSVYSEFDPVEFIVSYAARPSSPVPSTSATTCTSAGMTFLDLDDDDEESEDFKIRSRWSCSTLATLAPPTTGTPPSPGSASARLRFHLASVARRVRSRRAGGVYSNEGESCASSIHGAAPEALHVRSSSESALSVSGSAADLRRKPIPLELFAR